MALRLAEYVLAGELFNTKQNSVHGYLWLRDCDRPIMFQLTGNCLPDLAGHHLRFEARPNPMIEQGTLTEEEIDERRIAWMQIGVPGEMTAAKRVRAFDCSVDEFLRRSKLDEQPPTEWKRMLCLEWYGQNGRVVIELVDPLIEIDPDESGPATLSFFASERPSGDEASLDEDLDLEFEDDVPWPEDAVPWPEDELNEFDDDSADGATLAFEEMPDELDDDPYGLFPKDLEASLETSSSDQPWSDDTDPETLALWERLDAFEDHSKDVPLCTLFDPPLKVPRPESLDDEQVAQALNSILMELALHNVALHMCEHYTPRTAYELLVNDILRNEETHPDLPRSDMTQNFDTSSYCAECDAEFQRRYAERKSQNDSTNGDTPSDFDPDSDVPF